MEEKAKMNCRFYEQKYPQEGDLVLVTAVNDRMMTPLGSSEGYSREWCLRPAD
jgi:formyltetrahydrofolate synthetase